MAGVGALIREEDFLAWLRDRQGLKTWIGDDCAVLPGGQVVTTDVLVDGVHFDLKTLSARSVGRKALAVNLSDIAAMAARPRYALAGLVLPRRPDAYAIARDIMDGMVDLAREFDVDLVGGDTNVADLCSVSVTIIGEPWTPTSLIVRRSGAKVGDWLGVTGPLGGSLDRHHWAFEPRVALARDLVCAAPVHAMMDLSDGLALDVRRLAHASKVGVELWSEAIPRRRTDVSLEGALGDGEDFELLLSIGDIDDARRAAEVAAQRHGTQLAWIGRVVPTEKALTLRISQGQGTAVPLPDLGYQHRLS